MTFENIILLTILLTYHILLITFNLVCPIKGIRYLHHAPLASVVGLFPLAHARGELCLEQPHPLIHLLVTHP